MLILPLSSHWLDQICGSVLGRGVAMTTDDHYKHMVLQETWKLSVWRESRSVEHELTSWVTEEDKEKSPACQQQQQCAIKATTLWRYYCDHKHELLSQQRGDDHQSTWSHSRGDMVWENWRKREEKWCTIWCRPGDIHGSSSSSAQVERELLAVRREILEKAQDIKTEFNSPRSLFSFFSFSLLYTLHRTTESSS